MLWNPEQNLNTAYRLQLEKVCLCMGKDGYVPFFDPTGTVYNEGPQDGCIQPNKRLKHPFLLSDRNQPEGTDKYFHDVPFGAHFASELSEFHSVSSTPGVDGFTLKVDTLYKVEAGHQWYLRVTYVIGPESMAGPRVARSLGRRRSRGRRDLVASGGRLLLAESLMYDNEGAQLKNGTNMKWLSLEREEGAVAASFSPTGASLGSAIAAVALLLLALSGVCLLPGRCGTRRRMREAARATPEEHPLETEVAVPRGAGRAPDRRYCTVRDVTVLRGAGGRLPGQRREGEAAKAKKKTAVPQPALYPTSLGQLHPHPLQAASSFEIVGAAATTSREQQGSGGDLEASGMQQGQASSSPMMPHPTAMLVDPHPTVMLMDPCPTAMLMDPCPTVMLVDPRPTAMLMDPCPKVMLMDQRPTVMLTDPCPTAMLLHSATEDRAHPGCTSTHEYPKHQAILPSSAPCHAVPVPGTVEEDPGHWQPSPKPP
ncbi:extracellular matrix organizing protein FRAS1-like [Pluvialis apricaria]